MRNSTHMFVCFSNLRALRAQVFGANAMLQRVMTHNRANSVPGSARFLTLGGQRASIESWMRLSRSSDWEAYIAAFTGLGIVIHLILRFVFQTPPPVASLPLILTLLGGGIPLIVQL